MNTLARRLAAIAMTLWLIGIPIIAVFFNFQIGHSRFILIWAMLPLEAVATGIIGFIAGSILYRFYSWALGSPAGLSTPERIEKLERELGIIDRETESRSDG